MRGCTAGLLLNIRDHLDKEHNGRSGSTIATDGELHQAGYTRCSTCHRVGKRQSDGRMYKGHKCSSGDILQVQLIPPSDDRDVALLPLEQLWPRFLDLASMPVPLRPLPVHTIPHWRNLVKRLAQMFLDSPCDRTLFLILAAPKVILAPEWAFHNNAVLRSPQRRMNLYPAIPWPERRGRADVDERVRGNVPIWTNSSDRASKDDNAEKELMRQVNRQVRSGRLGRAAALLRDCTSVARLDANVLSKLRAKHPPGDEGQFGHGGPSSSTQLEQFPIRSCFKTFATDAGAGISGWTQPLLARALDKKVFAKFVQTLAWQIHLGIAPGRDMLCASVLTPLAKKTGGVRPIACSELLYRLCAKVLLHLFPPRDGLLPCQFGAGSANGVEPIVRLMERFCNKDDGMHEFGYVASLDAKNAFNSLRRSAVASGASRYARSLFHAARWRYDKASSLIVSQKGRITVLPSQAGVAQGDPLAPALFSVGIRDVLERLQAYLGDSTLVVAYLNDTYVFSKDPGVLSRIHQFFDAERGSTADSGLRLNLDKCSEHSRLDVQVHSLALLGTYVGGSLQRVQFLEDQVQKSLATPIERLRPLTAQTQVLLLRKCIQHNLCHLLRCFRPTDIKGPWRTCDRLLHEPLLCIRGGQQRAIDATLLSLPLKFGGVGVPMYSIVAPFARMAMEEANDLLLVQWGVLEGGISGATTSGEPWSQRELLTRCLHAISTDLLVHLDDFQLTGLLENYAPLSSQWLDSVPLDASTTLSDVEVSAGLRLRTLAALTAPCATCGRSQTFGHDDVCATSKNGRTARHETIKKTLARFLSRVPGGAAKMEPRVEGSSEMRTDLLVEGPAAMDGGMTSEFDITVVSLFTKAAPMKIDVSIHAEGEPSSALERFQRLALGVKKYLDEQAAAKTVKYAAVASSDFYPFASTLR